MPTEIIRYQKKLSGPILDRIDLYVDVDDIRHQSLLEHSDAESSNAILKRIVTARDRQQKRYKDVRITNSILTNQHIKQHAKLTKEAKNLLDQAAERLNLSARAYMKIIKVARTIADLDGHDSIGTAEVSEALQYRRQTSI